MYSGITEKPAGRAVCSINTIFLPDIDISESAIPFAAVAADLNTGEHLVLSKGPIVSAVMASCAVPGFMPPVELNGRILVDGGIVNSLPALLDLAQHHLHAVMGKFGRNAVLHIKIPRSFL